MISKYILNAMIVVLSVACSDGSSSGDVDSDSDSDSSSEIVYEPGTDVQTGLCDDDDATIERPAGWAKASHCKGELPNYDKLFDDTVVHRFDITVTPENYQFTMEDLASLAQSGVASDSAQEPMYVPVTVAFDGLVWDQVGMRYKGNSSLSSAYQSGIKKLSFRFNFDKFEDDYPNLKNQRFYGFDKMTFSNGYKDSSLIRDKLAADVFRAGGVPAARGAFARVYVDFGEGSTYFGLYTMIEDPSDEMLGRQFADDSGNLYKPEDDGASWEQFIESSFEKKTNEDSLDWQDVISAIDALHADRTDAETWRTGLESVFNTSAFLKCLALNQAMVNWDSYGTMPHNYYIYADPSDGGRLVWFPWDLNEALFLRSSGPGGRPGGQQDSSSSVMLDEVDDQWPLIRYLLDDSVYREEYKGYLQDALDISLDTTFVLGLMNDYHDLIAPYVTGEAGESSPYTFLNSDQEFEVSITDDLQPHIESRHSAVGAALD